MKAKDITGLRVGKLTVVARAGKQGNLTLWRCRCAYGRNTVRQLAALTPGTATMRAPCGRSYRNTRHGLRRHRLYAKWAAIRSRCEDPGNKDYANYGGRGIRLCIEWTNPEVFIRDLEAKEGYFPGATLDRKENDGPYSNDNTRWATMQQQNLNTRRNHRNGAQ